MSTHTLYTPEGPKTRPCNARCGDGWHAYAAFIDVPYDQMSLRCLATIVGTLDSLNPAIAIGDAVAAPEIAPYPDAPPDVRYGWAVYYQDRPADEPAPDPDADTAELHIFILEPDEEEE